MERNVMAKLVEWKNTPGRKPLLVLGARQVGKTFIMQEFGERYFSKCAYLNFEKRPELSEFFLFNKDPKRIMNELEGEFGKIDEDTLLIFDEVQLCPEALNSIKYFQEDAPEIPLVAAGSLLGIGLSQGFPVGKVSFLFMRPFSYFEFLDAMGETRLRKYLEKIDSISPIPALYEDKLKQYLKLYFLIGGMPEPISKYIDSHDLEKARNIQDEILLSYRNDFANHSNKCDPAKIRAIYDSLPSQLAKENKKFLYKAVKTGARAREYENALTWLVDAGIAHKVMRVEAPSIPLSTYEDPSCFKIYLNDVGLLSKHARLPYFAMYEGDPLFSQFKGALAENYVLSSILNQTGSLPHYWASDPYEADFLIETRHGIVPIEVKSGENVKAPSLKNYLKNHPEAPLGVRLSLLNLSYDGRILNVPLYLADALIKIVDVALNK